MKNVQKYKSGFSPVRQDSSGKFWCPVLSGHETHMPSPFEPYLGVHLINIELNGFNASIKDTIVSLASIWVPCSPSDTKKLMLIVEVPYFRK